MVYTRALVLLSTVVCLTVAVEVYDFDKTVEKFVNKTSEDSKQPVSWYDIYGKHPHLKTKAEYRRMHVTIHAPRFKYGDVKIVSSTSRVVHNKCFANTEPNKTRTVIVQSLFERNTTFEWRKSKIFKSGFSVSGKVKVPKIPLTVKLAASFSVSLSSTTEKKEHDRELVHNAQETAVPPMTAVCAKWTETVLEIEVPWTADVVASGHIAVWYRGKVNGHWLWFYPVAELADVDPKLKEIGNGVVVEVAGTFVGFGGTNVEMRLRQLAASDAPPTAIQLVGDRTVYGPDAPDSGEDSEEE